MALWLFIVTAFVFVKETRELLTTK